VEIWFPKGQQLFDDRNVGVGSCLTGQLVREQGKKVKGRSSVRRKVPSSGASEDELSWSASADSDGETFEPKGRPCSYASWVVVLWNSLRGIAATH